MERDRVVVDHHGNCVDDGNDIHRDDSVVASVATGDGPRTYEFELSSDGETVMVYAPPGTGRNLRMVWTTADTPVSLDHQACDTWGVTDGPITQQGVALRVVEEGGSVSRAICVMKNIWMGGNWIFNAIGFDHGSFVVLGTVDLSETFDPNGLVTQLPWRMCARVEGRSLDWKVWPTARAEPAWGDTMYGTTVTLPGEWVYPGRPGFYVGHLEMGDDAEFTDESVAIAEGDHP
jgi:hypothetical protein